MKIGLVMKLIKYDTLVQHRFVRIQTIPGIWMMCVFSFILLILLIVQTSTLIDELPTSYIYIYGIATITWGLYSIFELINFLKFGYSNSRKRFKRTNILVTAILVIFSIPLIKVLAIAICLWINRKNENKYFLMNSKFIHYLKYENEKRKLKEDILMSLVYLIPAFSMYINLSLSTMLILCASVIYCTTSMLASIEYSYAQYLKNSPFEEKILNRKLKEYEKVNGKIKVNKEIRKYREASKK